MSGKETLLGWAGLRCDGENCDRPTRSAPGSPRLAVYWGDTGRQVYRNHCIEVRQRHASLTFCVIWGGYWPNIA